MNGIQHGLIFLVRVYQKVISPAKMALFGPLGECRYQPSCSAYAAEAVRVHGAVKGAALAAWRICRCNPWGRFGADPVPPRRDGQTSSPQTTPARVIALAPRGTSGERDGERGILIEQPPLPGPLLHFVEEREQEPLAHERHLNHPPAPGKTLPTKFSLTASRCLCGGSHSAPAATGPRA